MSRLTADPRLRRGLRILTGTGGRRPGYLACVLLVLPLVVVWSLATPMEGVVDDSASLVTAAAVVRGEFGGPLVQTPAGQSTPVRVPGEIVALNNISDCLVDVNAPPNACGPAPKLSNAETATFTQFNRYPPLSYLLEGWPTLLFHGSAAYWAATLVAAVIHSLLLALALWLLVTFVPRRMAVLGWLVALTPQVLYLAGSLNASGFEIAAGTATWAGLLALATADEPPDRLIGCTVAAALMLMLARPTSPAWVALAILIAAIVAGRERVRALARRRSVRVGAAVLAGGALVALVWLLAAGKPQLLPVGKPPAPVSLAQALRTVLGAFKGGLVGQLGDFESYYIPTFAWAIWFAVFVIVCVGGAALAPRRAMWCAIGLAVLIVAVPLVVSTLEYNSYGFPWQGKDGTPYAVGLPLLAATLIPQRLVLGHAGRRIYVFALACFAVCAVATFVCVLHRFTNGVAGSWSPVHFAWQPLGGAYLLTAVFILAVLRLTMSAWSLTQADTP